MLQKKCGSAFFKDRGDVDCGCGWGNLCSSHPVTHVVQAYSTGLGWVDCKTAMSEYDAKMNERALLEKTSAWTVGGYERKTRIVPVDQSNCKDKYNK